MEDVVLRDDDENDSICSRVIEILRHWGAKSGFQDASCY
jgi:hypothetical protein